MKSMALKKNKSFTLVELSIVLSIIAILAATMAPVLAQGLDAWLMIRDQQIILTRARLAMNRMLEDIRFDCTGVRDDSLAEKLRFNTAPSITYDIQAGNLVRTIEGSTARVLARNAATLIVSYFPQNMTLQCNPPSNCSVVSGDGVLELVRFIRIRLTLRSDLDSNKIYTFESGVAPRRLLPQGN